MRQVAVIGAGGKIGQRLVNILGGRGETPVGVARRSEQIQEIERLGGRGALVDLESEGVDRLAAAIEGCDAVVFTAGAGPGSGAERKGTVDLAGAVMSAEAAAKAGIERFVQISAIGVDEPVPEGADESWAAYVEAKSEADRRLRESGLEWTILRPSRLTDDVGTGSIALGEAVEGGAISRDDVAALVAAVLDDPSTAGHQWNAVGGSRPIREAIEAAT